MINERITLEAARMWLDDLDALREEYAQLAVMDDRVMRSADRKRFNTLATTITIRLNTVEDVLRAVVMCEVLA